MNNQEILSKFPLNGRPLIRSLLESYQKKPNYPLEMRLRALGIGVDNSYDYDGMSRPEGFTLLSEVELSDLSEEEVATILAKFN